MQNIQEYIREIEKEYQTGMAREHSYRPALKKLIQSFNDKIIAVNEPSRVKCGAPDFIIIQQEIPLGYIEAKDIGKDLNSKEYKEQFNRYKQSLSNLIITDYLDFQLFIDGNLKIAIKIAEIKDGKIRAISENFKSFTDIITDFCSYVSQTITSSSILAKMMAGKAKLLAGVIEKALNSDEESQANSTLKDQIKAFKTFLIHDITIKEFGDIYAQTIAYGMFAARLHDETLKTFSRQEAAELIPKTNPFLRKLFQFIAGTDLDDRLVWIVDALADIFRATDVKALLKDFGGASQKNDPIIHFYETFLSEYDPKLRKARGVWYTPEPVVNFIVRAVDDILKTEFGIAKGIADSSKCTIEVEVQGTATKRKDKAVKEKREVHKVQILDPATGTGTFLAEIIKHIYKTKFKSMQGIWSSYVEDHLIPRLNGFELLMASYAMAHLKLDMLLSETGYKAKSEQRFRIYLTNALEEHHPDTGTLFASWLSNEANEANEIKRDTPVMVVLGNPPYSGESANKGDWIMELMEDYKKEPGGKEKLKEKNPKWINDDYVKFLRYGQHFVEKNGEGILAFINAHGFLDNPTFRGMRWNLLKTYDKIYLIDLHGNSKKKEVCPDGSKDENVFDIQQGVSINIFIKTGKKKSNELGQIHHYDLYGKREDKYDYLWDSSLITVPYVVLENQKPFYFFVQKNFELEKVYSKGFSVNDLFVINGVGMTTAHDTFVIDDSKEVLLKRFTDFKDSQPIADDLHKDFNVNKKEGWDILKGWNNLQNVKSLNNYIKPVSYRPFDNKYIFYENKLVWRTVIKVMQHFLKGDNVGLIIGRQGQVVGTMQWNLSFITKQIIDFNMYYRGGGVNFPLYLYPDKNETELIDQSTERKPNLNMDIVKDIAEKLKLNFTNEKEESDNTFAPIDLLDYIYAVLHSPSYREKYKEFLKIDFPRVPYPKDKKTFWTLAELGGEVRQIHLLESPKVEEYITRYPEDGSNTVDKPKWKAIDDNKGQVWINDNQYFDNVPKIAWEFYIGGYQPAQKWLKDRKGRELSFEDILHYQKIIVALSETDRIMGEIDKTKIE